jgi:outer membrane protein|tara:strand:+ start:967 stop:1509 length:543 start_codon:yes stop_codon:yes gene_type:complete
MKKESFMLKIIQICAMTLAATLIPFSAWGQNNLKIGYVNAQAIIAESSEAKLVESQFQREMIPWESELQSLQAEIEVLIEQYQAQQASMPLESRVVREDLIVRKQQELQNRAQEIESLASSRREELVQPLMEKITSIIEVVRREGSYTFIFDSSAGVFLSADESFDLTETVTQRLAAGGS